MAADGLLLLEAVQRMTSTARTRSRRLRGLRSEAPCGAWLGSGCKDYMVQGDAGFSCRESTYSL